MSVRFSHVLKHGLYSSSLFVASMTAMAGNGGNGGSMGVGRIEYEPLLMSVGIADGAVGVPLFGGAALVMLSVLLGLVSIRFFRDRKRSGSLWLITATVSAALASGGSGLKLISDVNAGPPLISLMSDIGGEIPIPMDGTFVVRNTSGIGLRITGITLNNECVLLTRVPVDKVNGGVSLNGGLVSLTSSCLEGTVLDPSGGECDLDVCCDPEFGENGGDINACFLNEF
ncbi:MAG: midcut-by-XrtH protein [Pseudomonadota bacterium]